MVSIKSIWSSVTSPDHSSDGTRFRVSFCSVTPCYLQLYTVKALVKISAGRVLQFCLLQLKILSGYCTFDQVNITALVVQV